MFPREAGGGGGGGVPSEEALSPSQGTTWPGCHWWPQELSQAPVPVRNQTPDYREWKRHGKDRSTSMLNAFHARK